MAGWYELTTNPKGQYSFVLKAGNAEVILRSEQYEAKSSALGGIASVQKNSPDAKRYDSKDAKDGRTYFNLKVATTRSLAPARCTRRRPAATRALPRSRPTDRAPRSKRRVEL